MWDSQYTTSSFLRLALVLLSTAAASPLSERQAPPANLTPLKTCPAQNSATIIANHLGYSLCSLSQYNVPSQQWPVVANDAACATLCSQTNGCTTAVFDRTNKNCHIKGNPSSASYNFVYDNRFDAIRLAYTPVQLQKVTSCPFGGYSYTGPDGAVYDVCPMTDYPVYSYQVIHNINSATACAALCTAQNNACTNAVYDNVYNYCHIKGTLAANVAWNVNTQFDTIKMRTPPPSKTTSTTTSTTSTSAASASFTPVDRQPITGSSCPSGGSNYTTASGAVYLVCPYSDFNVGNTLNQATSGSATSCADLCAQTAGCAFAVYEPGWCHLKGIPSAPNWVQSTWYTSVQMILAPPTNASSTATAACPSGTSYTSKNGINYNICPNSDYNVNNLATVAAADPPTCAETCSTTPGCYYVVYEPGWCHIKGAPTSPNPQSSNFYSTISVSNATANTKAMSPRNGQWSSVIPLPVIPVAAYVVPAYPVVTKFLSFAAWSPITWGGPQQYQTAFGSFDLTSNTAGAFTVANTNHNMFCPGINALADGRLIVDGGDTNNAATVYDAMANTFTRVANMTMGRGYQSSVTLSDGRGFTIGGSWSGGYGGVNGVPMKNGEVYDPVANTWTALPGALVQNMLTTYDNGGAFRTDNHGWLYAWSGGSVFQAGPSKNMNWYSTSGQGGVQGAGQRNANNDQMCGVNVMYDNGKIFAAGGQQSYQNDNALSVAHQITLNGVNQAPSVSQLPNMNYARMYANAVVFPNGQVFITGGQGYGVPFSDAQSVLQAEIWDPASNTFTLVAPASVPRNYHSTALLMPDGRVMSGGGGLCMLGGNCLAANHEDMQFYTPPYLFDASGNPATRPSVNSISGSQQSGQKVQVNPGGSLTVSLDSTANLSHVLVRMGSSTHSVNTDQRRIPLSVQSTSGNTVTLGVPNDNGVVPPGFWYYFAVAPSGVHSIGLTVNVLKA